MGSLVQVASNLGDVLVSIGEQQVASGQQEAARESYGKAMEAYSNACSTSSSEAGDDLPGLLHNWGVGLHSAGTCLQVTLITIRAFVHIRRKCYR